jgi:MFS transporter, DHA3 family, tetracycline resistance protein
VSLRGKRLEAYPVYLLLEGAASLFLSLTYAVNLVYQVQVAHLNALQLVLIGTALEGTCLLLQVPTGIFADVVSRRSSILLGILFLGLGGFLQGAFALFATILLSSVVAGIGYCFLGGAEEAWIASEVGEERVAHVFLRGAQVGQVCSLAGVLLGTSLALLRLDLPLLAGGVLMVALAVALALVMPERHFTPAQGGEHPSWQALTSTLRQSTRLVRRSPLLLTIVVVALFGGMSSEGFDRLNVAHFLQDFTVPSLGPLAPVAWFGCMKVVATLLGLVAVEIARRRIAHEHPTTLARALLALDALLVASMVAFGLARGFALALVAYWGVSVLRNTVDPLYTAWLTRSAPAEVRATVVSMSGQMDALGQVAAGPVVGIVGLLRSLRAALVMAGVLLSPAVLLYTRTLRKDFPLAIGEPAQTEEKAASN